MVSEESDKDSDDNNNDPQPEDDDEEEGEGTAKMEDRSTSVPNHVKTIEQRGLVTQRLSSIFDGWLPSSPTAANSNNNLLSSEKRKSVSEPRLLEHASPISLQKTALLDTADNDGDDDFEATFEEMLASKLPFTICTILICV